MQSSDEFPLTIGATQEVEDEYELGQFFGFVKGQIVGLRYYSGMVSNKEMVALVRQPFNPYDCNAVRVNNTMGQQVGHIKREMARGLAEVVDQGLASIEGLVPYGANNVYSMAVEISFWGDPANRDQTVHIMRKYGYHMMMEHPKPQKSQGNSQQQIYTQARSRATRITSEQMKNELDGLFEKLKEVDQTAEEEACPAIKSELYKHQKQAVAWMRKKETGKDLPPFWEETKPTAKNAAKAQGKTVYHNTVTNYTTTDHPMTVKGGILADDMGLGKTLATISLILGNSWNGKAMHKLVDAGKEPVKTVILSSDTKKAKSEQRIDATIDLTEDDTEENNNIFMNEVTVETTKTTLPQSEPIQPFEGVLEVEVELTVEATQNTEGRSRRASKRPTRYVDELEIEVEDETSEKNSKRKSAKKKKRSKVAEDEDYVPNEELKMAKPFKSEVKTGARQTTASLNFIKEPIPNAQPHATLIVCPLSLISNWVGQIEEHVHSAADVKILVFHGPVKAQVNGKILAEQDIVVTTYQTLAMEMKKSTNTLLFKTNWLRVVLDEGHIIRNPNAKLTKACNQLKTQRKWILTGTPIQNSTKDLFSIISFLGVEPFTNMQWWRRTIQRPINDGDANALKRIRCLMGGICMRRTKQQKVNGKPIIHMPPKDIFMQSIDMNDQEREMYNKMDKASKQAMRAIVAEGFQTTQYADMLVYIMRLRQICCHPHLAKEALEALSTGGIITKEAKELLTKLLCMLEAGSVDDCCVCLDPVTSPVITKCSHVFCKLCICGVIATNIRNRMEPRCPLCRSTVQEEDLVEPPAENDDVESGIAVATNVKSSKVNALMFELLKMNKEKPNVKSLVVSQFTEYLKIIQGHLVASNIPCVLYHGGMTRKAREDAIWHLQSGQAKVMLLSLKAGGVGLNLTAASQVFLMEPSWNLDLGRINL